MTCSKDSSGPAERGTARRFDVSHAQAIVAPITRVIASARERRLPIVYLTMNLDGQGAAADYWTAERQQRWVAAGEPLRTRDASVRLPPGVNESDILTELTPESHDIRVVKSRHSGFYYTQLDAILREQGISTLIFTGGTTSICVESTLRDAFFRDYRCILLSDCTTEPIGNRLTRTNYEVTLMLVELVYGWVTDSGSVIGALGGSKADTVAAL